METRYEVRLVVLKDCDTALDMTIGCENAQQLDKAKRVIDERLIDYIAMFAVEQGLTGNLPIPTKMAEPASKPETITPPLQKRTLQRRKASWLRSTLSALVQRGS
ncbi:MAG: hypothetical protein ACI4JC_01180 [Faecalibacterium sp.]